MVNSEYIYAKQKPLYKQFRDDMIGIWISLFLLIIYLGFGLNARKSMTGEDNLFHFPIIGILFIFCTILILYARIIYNYFFGVQYFEYKDGEIILTYKMKIKTIMVSDVIFFNRTFSVSKAGLAQWNEAYYLKTINENIYIRNISFGKDQGQKINDFFLQTNYARFTSQWESLKNEYKEVTLEQVMSHEKNVQFLSDIYAISARGTRITEKKYSLSQIQYIEYGFLHFCNYMVQMNLYESIEKFQSKKPKYKICFANNPNKSRGDLVFLLYLKKYKKIDFEIKNHYISMRIKGENIEGNYFYLQLI